MRFLEKHYDNNAHTVISLDVEGLDLSILQSIDFNSYRPAIFCVETISYTQDLSGSKNHEIIDLLIKHNYLLYSDTHINSIFVDRKLINI